MTDLSVDVLIAGGSIAGLATAAALREFGWSVLVVEPGQKTDRRLAGELIHPLGVAGLKELGLFDPEAFTDAVAIDGFAVFPEAGETGSRVMLSYGRPCGTGERALAIDYAILRRNLDTAARKLSHVSFLDGGRVKAIDTSDPASAQVLVEHGGATITVRCRMVVAADGASSPVRGLAGIGHTRRSISTIAGYVIDKAALPAPGYGHVMVGGPSVVLAYEIGGGRARVMFDQPVECDSTAPEVHRQLLLDAIPEPLRHQVASALTEQRPLSFMSAEVIAHTTSRGPVVLVGDAGGSCHPLTATGMTIGIRDGLRLRDALRRHKGDIPAAFARYDRVRRRAQRSRRMVASALHDVCSRRDPEQRVLRNGLIRYWRQDADSRLSTMAILGMSDDSIASAFWHFLKVIRHGLSDHWSRQRTGAITRVGVSAKIMTALGALAIKQVGASIKAR